MKCSSTGIFTYKGWHAWISSCIGLPLLAQLVQSASQMFRWVGWSEVHFQLILFAVARFTELARLDWASVSMYMTWKSSEFEALWSVSIWHKGPSTNSCLLGATLPPQIYLLRIGDNTDRRAEEWDSPICMPNQWSGGINGFLLGRVSVSFSSDGSSVTCRLVACSTWSFVS